MGVKVFVYGTLRKGERNHQVLVNAKLIAEQAWINGELHDTGYGYPVVKVNHNDRVYGELYEISLDDLSKIDQLEGYTGNSTDNLYSREEMSVYTDVGEFTSFVYLAGEQLTSVNKIIPNGDWKVYQYNNSQSSYYYYFAYGSCMDDERFIQYNVKQYFNNIVGRGILHGYSVKFTLNKGDGGKADMVEDRSNLVEGVIYKIPVEAKEYLYWREGVKAGWYRPAIIDVNTEKGELKNVLTFFVIDKGKETAPSNLYETEILRGGRPYLSESYIQKLEKHMRELKIRFE